MTGADPDLGGEDAAQVEPLRRFVAAHGGSGTAVVSYLGHSGARIVVVAADGRLGDAVVRSVDAGVAVCAAAGIALADGWDRELSAVVRFTDSQRRRMGGT